MPTLNPVVFPARINRACAVLFDAPEFRDLPDSYVRVVLAIIKKINLSNLHSTIFATRAALAAESGRSLETVHRAIRWLEAHGFIERQQKARAGLRGSSSPLTPTVRLIQCLLLDQAGDTDKNRVDESRSTQESGSPFTRIGRFLVPSDLTWLHKSGGLSPTAILKLMACAKLRGQRLSDIVKVAYRYIASLRGNNLFAYLLSLTKKDKDYKGILDAAQKEVAAQQEKEMLRNKSRELDGRMFRNRERGLVTEVISGMLYLRLDSGESLGAAPFCLKFLHELQEGKWVSTRGFSLTT